MNLSTGTVRPQNVFSMINTASQHTSNTGMWQSPQKPSSNSNATLQFATSTSPQVKLCNNWMEFQGIKNWDGLLDPLHDDLRDEILRYGEFVDAAYRCFYFDASSPHYASCLYPEETMMAQCGLGDNGYCVTKSLHATCGVQLPNWTDRINYPSWMSKQTSWIGYVAVCMDQDEIERLGRRDVVIAYRGTCTCLEWLENLRATLTCLPDDMAPDTCQSMVQSGFLSLYTSRTDACPSLQDLIREEIEKILVEYADEPLSITVVGHSLGAALATITAHDITTSFKHAPMVTAVSFGGPRVGNESFRCQLEKNGTKVLRIVNSDDLITKVPGFVSSDVGVRRNATGISGWVQRLVEETQWVYAEIGKELRLSSKDCPHLSGGNVATCHDLKTYLHLVDNFVSSNCPLRATAKRVIKC